MFIEDPELRALFKAESEEHLQRLEQGLLKLEKTPDDDAVLVDIFREAHSLKGASRMLGATDIEAIAHLLEDVLGTAKNGEEHLSNEAIERLYPGLDAIKALVLEAVNGEAGGVDVKGVIAQMNGSVPPPERARGELRPTEARTQPDPARPAKPHEERSSTTETYKIETIRVRPQKLDALMVQAGELVVTQVRISRLSTQVSELLDLWEEAHGEGGNAQALNEHMGPKLKALKTSLQQDSARLDAISSTLEQGIRAVRLLPLSTVFALFPRMVRDLAKAQGKEVELVVSGGETQADKRLIEGMKDPLMHLLRNAVDHGIETPEEREAQGKPRWGTIELRAEKSSAHIVIELSDDGRGLDVELIKTTAQKRGLRRPEELETMDEVQLTSLIFAPGFSTSPIVTDLSGRGVGMDVVRANVEQLKGTVEVNSGGGQGCQVRVQLPITLTTAHVLTASANDEIFAFPVEHVDRVCLVAEDEVFSVEGKAATLLDGRPVSVASLHALLELSGQDRTAAAAQRPCVVLSAGGTLLGVFVEALLDMEEVVAKPLGALLKRVRNVSGTTILDTGAICTLLNPQDLVKTVRRRSDPVTPSASQRTQSVRGKRRVLFAEDSITTRTQIKRILEGAGYEVTAAVDGLDALNKVQSEVFDAVISDVEMPHLDGLALTAKLREMEPYKEIPVILVTSLASDEDKRRGIEVGANAYITKPSFQQEAFLDTLSRLI